MKKALKSSKYLVIVFLASLANSGSASATAYECSPKQVVWWHEGKIEPYVDSPGHRAARHALIRFDDAAGDLEWEFDRESPVSKDQFEIISRIGFNLGSSIIKRNGNMHDIVAIKKTPVGSNTDLSFFHLYTYDKGEKHEIYFMYTHASVGSEIYSGDCQEVDDQFHLEPK